MNRLRLRDLRTSRLASIVGQCAGDIGKMAELANAAQRRLVFAPEAGDEGWWGGWAEVAFTVDTDNPAITLPRELARLQNITVSDNPVPIRNQWFEFVQFGTGRLANGREGRHQVQILSRNNTPTRRTMSDAPQLIRVRPQSGLDNLRRILIQGEDASGNTLRSVEDGGIVEGIYLGLQLPFVDTPIALSRLTGLQKDVTAGSVKIMQLDPLTGEEIELHELEPSETTGWYRRYVLSKLPCEQATAQVRGIAKLELIPAKMDTDYLLIQELEAMVEECMAVHYAGVDTDGGKNYSVLHHANAIGFLKGQLRHYMGSKEPTIVVAPFGSARLERQQIGLMI